MLYNDSFVHLSTFHLVRVLQHTSVSHQAPYEKLDTRNQIQHQPRWSDTGRKRTFSHHHYQHIAGETCKW